MKKIFITGGHFSPAAAVISLLEKSGQWQIYYVGRRTAMEDDPSEALEYRELFPDKNLHYLVITTGRLQRRFFVNVGQSLKSLSKMVSGLLQAFYWLGRYRPNVVLSFGGYVALPVVVAAYFFGVPVITHEQTLAPGLANKIIFRLSRKVLISWPVSGKHFPESKVVLTGNPLREKVKELAQNYRPPDGSDGRTPQIYITGGNQGAHVINLAVEEILGKLLEKYRIVHQTGDSCLFKDFDRLVKLREKLPAPLAARYELHKFLNETEVAGILAGADLVISRSGANTVTELAAVGLPAVFIPLPFATGGEQLANARLLKDRGAAEILDQEHLTGRSLLSLIDRMIGKIGKYREAARASRSLISLEAGENIVQQIENLTIRS